MEAVTANVKWYDETIIGDLSWPDTEYGQYAKNYILPLISGQSSSCYIHNVHTRLLVAAVDGIPLPVTVNDAEYDNSYVCSPYTHYVTYAGEELSHLRNRPAEALLGGVLNMIGLLLRKARFNHVVQVNNWLLSTNLYPALSPGQLAAVIDEIRRRYPRHAILCRSLNRTTCGRYLEAVQKKGCKLVPSRQIYLLHGRREQDAASAEAVSQPVNAKARWLVKRDRGLITKNGYTISGPADMQPEDVPRIKELYNMLYIHKYSVCNPQFTEQFIHLAIEKGTLELYGLRKNGRLDAVLGFFVREGIMTAPLFGYDTTMPQKTGLYRMLSAVLIGIAEERGLLLHESSGVGQFKRNRGAVAELEVTAVYDRHLPFMTRACWTILEKLLCGIGVPIIRKLKL